MTTKLRPARAVKPGNILGRELEARGWTQKEFAQVIGRPPQTVNEIIAGKKAITPETALLFSAAFGTSAELWLNLESNYRLRLLEKSAEMSEVARRAQQHTALAAERGTKKRGRTRQTPFHLDILVEESDGGYAAHCLQLDLVSVGSTEESAVSALMDLIRAQLDFAVEHGNIENILKPAPQELWVKLLRRYSGEPKCKRLTVPAGGGTPPIESTVCYV
ncbi:MAG: HigA family addiction module antitoxin [Armatimonadetes bacterium]|nr:HigA family addiction module antitoxin [Armatimonadota bacterium]